MRWCCLTISLLLITPAWAQQDPVWFPNDYEGLYFGGGVAFTNVLASSGNGAASWERGDTDYGFQVSAGWRFNPWFALEVAYLEGGEPEFNDNSPTGRAETEIDLTAFQFAGVGTLPIGEIWEIYLKLGVSAWDADSEQVLTPIGGPSVGAPRERQRAGLSDGHRHRCDSLGEPVRAPRVPDLSHRR